MWNSVLIYSSAKNDCYVAEVKSWSGDVKDGDDGLAGSKTNEIKTGTESNDKPDSIDGSLC
jgi:hypothetical protein